MSNFLGTLAVSANTKTTFTAPSSGCKAIRIGNESGLTITVKMEGSGVEKTLYPSSVDWFSVLTGFTGNIQLTVTAILNNTNTWPSSTLIFDAIGTHDPEDGSRYPLALNRNTNVGNTVATNMGSSTTLQNDNNADDTQVIEAQVAGSPSSTVRLGNNGNFFIKQYISGVLTTLFQVIENAATCVQIAATGKLTEILGSLTVDQNLTVTGTSTQAAISCTTLTGSGQVQGSTLVSTAGTTVDGTLVVVNTSSLDNGSLSTDGGGNVLFGGKLGVTAAGDVIDASSASTLYLKCRSSGTIVFQSPNGTQIGSLDSSGNFTINGQLRLNNNKSVNMQKADTTTHDILYIDGANEVKLQHVFASGDSSPTKLYISDRNGANLFSIDVSGNVRAKGTITPSVTP